MSFVAPEGTSKLTRSYATVPRLLNPFLAQYKGCTKPGRQIARALNFYGCAWVVWVRSIELASCHLSGAQNFEVVCMIFEKVAHPCPTRALYETQLCI